ncbi:MAG: glycosyltransferase, partial [Lachnospiraceae bacterium]|nr:glycosyltransferase [Lachnospiraceae bacterium]
MKRVLIVTTVSGFVPQFEMNNVRILQEMGYEVHYASNFKNPHYGKDNHRLEGTGVVCHQVDFVRSPFRFIQNMRAYAQLRKLMRENQFQMVHCHTPMGGVLARLAARKYRRTGTKVLYTAHGFHFYKGAPVFNWLFYYPVEWLLARWTDVLITINEEDYQRA